MLNNVLKNVESFNKKLEINKSKSIAKINDKLSKEKSSKKYKLIFIVFINRKKREKSRSRSKSKEKRHDKKRKSRECKQINLM